MWIRQSRAKWVFIVCFASAAAGCGDLQFATLQSPSEYSKILGKEYVIESQLLIFGINAAPNGERIQYWVGTFPPGIGGPEVKSSNTLPQGTVIRADHVIRCENCIWQYDYIIFTVESEVNTKIPDFRFRDINSNAIRKIGDKFTLNPELFKET
jgi:hypothetical protein